MIPYQTRIAKLSSTRYGDVKKETFRLFRKLEKQTKRKPYIRSAYFYKQKIFFDYFWYHIFQKNPRERIRRLQFFPAALEVVRHSRNSPEVKENPHVKGEILYRFAGLTHERELFYVQIKEDKKSGSKYLMSVFPG